MEYSQALSFLYEQLPMYQRVGAAAYKNNLDNTLVLDAAFSHPHVNFKTIHVAGTNGKGSVSHMLASVLQCAGYKVGLYTSPHLKDFRERIKVNGKMITEEAVANFVSRYLEMDLNIAPSFFELTVLMCFDYFASENVDVAIIEVGLGGRLDSTNIISPELSVITNISFDHTQLLGNTLELIAAEKAGIIKKNIPVVIGEYNPQTAPVFEASASKMQSKIVFADKQLNIGLNENETFRISNQKELLFDVVNCGLKGDYQQKNCVTTIASLLELKRQGWNITDSNIHDGIANVVENTGLLGRWQQLGQKPTIICDTGHNEAGISWVVKQLEKQQYEKLYFVIGMVNDKSIDNVLQLLPKNAIYYFTKAKLERALNETSLMEQAKAYGLKGNCYPSVQEAFNAAKKQATEQDFIFVGGSTFVVAEVI